MQVIEYKVRASARQYTCEFELSLLSPWLPLASLDYLGPESVGLQR